MAVAICAMSTVVCRTIESMSKSTFMPSRHTRPASARRSAGYCTAPHSAESGGGNRANFGAAKAPRVRCPSAAEEQRGGSARRSEGLFVSAKKERSRSAWLQTTF